MVRFFPLTPAYAKHTRTIRMRMLSICIPMVRTNLAYVYFWYAHAKFTRILGIHVRRNSEHGRCCMPILSIRMWLPHLGFWAQLFSGALFTEVLLAFLKWALKVPSHQIGSAWKWYVWICLGEDTHRYRFLTFFLMLGHLQGHAEHTHKKQNGAYQPQILTKIFVLV